MENLEALRIIRALAEGRDPSTSEELSPLSVLHQPETIRALVQAIAALQSEVTRAAKKTHLPAKVGNPWLRPEEEQLCGEFDLGMSIWAIAKVHGRTRGGITARLEKLGKFPRQGTMNFFPASGEGEAEKTPPIQNAAEHRGGEDSPATEPDRPWMPVEDARLCKDFWRLDLGQIANSLKRSRVEVYSRLVHLGKISPNRHSSAT